jgi:hypothetical protein
MVFAKLIKKLQLPSVYYEAAFESLQASKIKLSSAIPTSLSPGDIVTFSYEGGVLASSRRFLIVGTDNHPGAKYISGRGNYLICGYDLTSRESYPGLVMVFNSFYKNRNSNYSKMSGTMASIFGGSFKTFKASGMRSLYKLEASK